MPLKMCPHMTARCPHCRKECDDAESKDCHYIKKTTASTVTAVTALRMFGVERLSPAMRKYLQETEDFLREIGIPLKEKR